MRSSIFISTHRQRIPSNFMDETEILINFCGVTGADTDSAASFLAENGWNLEYCINQYLEGNFKTPGNVGSAGLSNPPNDISRAQEDFIDIPPDDDGAIMDDMVRAPIMPKTEVLVDDDPYARLQRRRQMQTGFDRNSPRNVFEMFRDINQEGKPATMQSSTPADAQNKKLKTLADLFRPPIDLIEPGPFDAVKLTAMQRHKWLLVNIQEIQEFDCQKLNRDTWSDPAVKSVVGAHFVLWQVLQSSEEGARYCRFYPVTAVPHLAIIDSRTGERLETWEGFIDARALTENLTRFLESNCFDDDQPKVIIRPESPKKGLGDLSEEAQLAEAISASLHGSPSSVHIESDTKKKSGESEESKPIMDESISAAALQPLVQEEDRPVHLKELHANASPERTCVIQVRLPSGPIKGYFQPTDKVKTLHQYVSLHLDPATRFTLVSSFPRRSFTPDQLDLTLQEADLVPRAALMCEITS